MFLLRHPLPADLFTPLAAYLALRPQGASLLLESADQGERVGRYSFILLEGPGELKLPPPARGWVEALRAFAGAVPTGARFDPEAELAAPREPLPLGVGCAGYLGFEAVGALEPSLPLPTRDSLGLPGLWVRRFDTALVFDHLHQVAELQTLAAEAEAGFQRLRVLRAILRAGTPDPGPDGSKPAAQALSTREAYESMVVRAQDRILDGDVYQLVPSQRFEVSGPPAPLAAYRRLRRLNPSPYGFLLEWDGFALVGASPEMLVRVMDGEAETLPIAGTVPRGASAEEDTVRFEALRRDPKELAEHQMLVDLARNDLGRVAVPGGVRVERPLALQRTSHVLHLTTTVKATLKPGVDALDVLAAAFPAGTVSGAPKLRACQRIAEMEGEVRGPYGGVLLRLGADGALDTALILRTAVYAKGRAYLQAGAGVVRASQPAAEYFETLHKLGAVAQALGVDLSGGCPVILLIDALDSFTYNLVQAFETLGAQVRVVRHDAIDLDGAKALGPEAVVLSPGPGHPTESLAHMALAGSDWGVPMLGVCLGHQALAAATGGRVVRAREPLHGEATPLAHDGSGLFRGLPEGLPIGRYHSLIVDMATLQDCWRVTGRSPGNEVMAMTHRSLPRWGVQFHPESILTPDGPAMLANFLQLVKESTR